MRAPGRLCLEAITGWEQAFFESEFTHAALGAHLTTHPEGFLGLWRDLTGSQKDVPPEYLVRASSVERPFEEPGLPQELGAGGGGMRCTPSCRTCCASP